jgi:hypothetical protein
MIPSEYLIPITDKLIILSIAETKKSFNEAVRREMRNTVNFSRIIYYSKIIQMRLTR